MLIVSDGRHGAVTIWVPAAMRTAVCRSPRTWPDAQTRRAWWPEYQPNRNASTRKDLAVVDTYRRKLWPGRTLCWSAYPSIAPAGPRSVIRHADVPGRLFSATGNGGATPAVADGALVDGTGVAALCPAEPDPAVHPAAAGNNARATATPAARCIRFIVTRPTEPHHGTAPGSGQQTRLGVPLSPSLTK